MMSKPRIGFIGLGDMGRPMARRLLEAGYTVASCANRRREAFEALKPKGLIEESSPRAVGARSDILLTLVVDDKQTDAVLLGPDGALAGLPRGAIVLIMSTLAPTYCRQMAERAAGLGITVLDCPISGGPPGAEQGTLALIAGGDAAALETARSALEVLGKPFLCGGVGAGQIAKLANNALAFVTAGALVEVRALARAYGMDIPQLMQIINCSTGRSFVSAGWESFLPSWDHLALLGQKDISLCLEVAKAAGVPLPLVALRAAQGWALPPEEKA